MGWNHFARFILIFKVRNFWETHKIWKNLPHGLDKSADLFSKRQNNEEDFFQIMCASQKVWTLTNVNKPSNIEAAEYSISRIKTIWENEQKKWQNHTVCTMHTAKLSD